MTVTKESINRPVYTWLTISSWSADVVLLIGGLAYEILLKSHIYYQKSRSWFACFHTTSKLPVFKWSRHSRLVRTIVEMTAFTSAQTSGANRENRLEFLLTDPNRSVVKAPTDCGSFLYCTTGQQVLVFTYFWSRQNYSQCGVSWKKIILLFYYFIAVLLPCLKYTAAALTENIPQLNFAQGHLSSSDWK